MTLSRTPIAILAMLFECQGGAGCREIRNNPNSGSSALQCGPGEFPFAASRCWCGEDDLSPVYPYQFECKKESELDAARVGFVWRKDRWMPLRNAFSHVLLWKRIAGSTA